jgi:hypothetical protein
MTTETDTRSTRRGVQPEKREIAFYVRAKTGPGPRDWSPVGVCFPRKNGAEGFTIKLNTWPIDTANFKGALVLVPPFAEQEEVVED